VSFTINTHRFKPSHGERTDKYIHSQDAIDSGVVYIKKLPARPSSNSKGCIRQPHPYLCLNGFTANGRMDWLGAASNLSALLENGLTQASACLSKCNDTSFDETLG
jgi:hypothetical protein